jgi:hypothetical protein
MTYPRTLMGLGLLLPSQYKLQAPTLTVLRTARKVVLRPGVQEHRYPQQVLRVAGVSGPTVLYDSHVIVFRGGGGGLIGPCDAASHFDWTLGADGIVPTIAQRRQFLARLDLDPEEILAPGMTADMLYGLYFQAVEK